MMKTNMTWRKALALLLALTMMLAVTGCSTNGPTQEEYDALLAEIETQQEEIETLRTLSEELQAEIDSLLEEKGEMTEEIATLMAALEGVNGTLTEAEETLEQTAAEVQEKRDVVLTDDKVPTSQPSTPPTSQAPQTSKPASSTPSAPAASGGAFAGHTVTVKDKATPATSIVGKPNDPNTMIFVSSSGTELGSISYSAYNAIIKANKKTVTLSGGGTVGVPPSGDNWETWFAQQFNAHRGVANSTTSSSSSPPAANSGLDIDKANDMISLVNKERTANGLDELSIDSALTALAQTRAKEISTKFSHTRPDGSSVTDANYVENLHSGQSTASGAFNSWMNSTGHKETMLSPYVVSVGSAAYKDSGGTMYWVLVFSFE